jgi:hypothetical protein
MSQSVKAPNYSEAQIAVIVSASEAGVLNANTAAVIATEIGKSKRSVIAKIKSLDLDYVAAVRPTKGVRDVTKADIVQNIAVVIGTDSADLKGLEKATAKALKNLLAQVEANEKEDEADADSETDSDAS